MKVVDAEVVRYFWSMPVQTQHRFNVSEYYLMAEVGVLKPDAQVELLNGRVVDSSRITPFHAAVTRRLSEPFFKLPEESCIVSIRNPVRLDGYNELQPDVMLLKPSPDDYTSRHPQPDDVLLLIEVSDTTLDLDRVEKLPAYGRAGIAEVWIVNLVDQVIEIHREPHFTGYPDIHLLTDLQQFV